MRTKNEQERLRDKCEVTVFVRTENEQERLREVVSATQPKSRLKFLIPFPLARVGQNASSLQTNVQGCGRSKAS